MSWQGYVPKEVWRLFGDDPTMANILYKYGSLAKHEVNDEEIVFLFNEISDLKFALFEVTGNFAIQGKKLELAKDVLTEIAGPNFADKIGVKARECLEKLK